MEANEEKKLEELRSKKQREQALKKAEKELNIPKSVVEYTDTGIDEFDNRGIYARLDWIKKAKANDYFEDEMFLSTNGTVHIIEEWVDLVSGEQAAKFPCGSQSYGNAVSVENLDLHSNSYCKRCMKFMRKLAGANKAIRTVKSRNKE